MAIRIPLIVSCALFLCASLTAEESAPSNKNVLKVVGVTVSSGAAGEQLKKATEAQRAANKKLAEAVKAEAEAAKALAAAKKEAAKKVADAEAALNEAKKTVANARDLVRKAAATRARVLRSGYPRASTVAVRENVDPQDPIERFALLTPAGPLVVQVAITVDGKPFRVAREELIDELLAAADQDDDGTATWEEALATSRFTLGRVRVVNDQQRQQYLKTFDKNENGLVDRAEARLFVAQYFQGPAFTLGRGYGYGYGGNFGGAVVFVNGQATYRGGGSADLQKFLDSDKDGVLSMEEIAAAGDRLKSRDADDNDLLYPQEIRSPATTTNRRIRTYTGQPQQPSALLLGPTAKAEPLFKALQSQYKNEAGEVLADSFAAVPELFASLDKNKDGKLQQDETLALNDAKPHVELALDLGKKDKPTGLSIKAIAPQLTKSKESPEAVSLELPGVKLAFTANLAQARTADYSQTAKTYLTRFDKDGNGYLEKNELQAGFAQQFDLWDADGDGKAFPKEITASYERMQAPRATQVRASAARHGNSLFQALDLSGDGRLSLREMRNSPERIKIFDGNKDNRISRDEIPVMLSASFGLGNAGFGSYRNTQGANRPRPTNSDVPDWFTRMDRNGDGDVTLKEFLGDKERFEKLDTNGDGFIEPKEAKAADQSS